MAKSLSLKDRPEELLDSVVPVIDSDGDLDKALHELSFLDALTKSIDARISEQIELVKKDYEAEKVYAKGVDRSGKTTFLMTVNDRVEQLKQIVVDYCESHRKELLPGKSKTVKFPHGEISFKLNGDKIEYRTKLTEKDSLSLLDKLMPATLVEQIAAWLKSICIFGKKESRLLAEIIELKPKISITKIKQAYQSKRLNNAHLKQLGLKFTKAKDQVEVKPALYETGS